MSVEADIDSLPPGRVQVMNSYVLYAVEEIADEGPALLVRYDENGAGTPLLWRSQDEAAKAITEQEEATGCHGEMQVVELRGEVPPL